MGWKMNRATRELRLFTTSYTPAEGGGGVKQGPPPLPVLHALLGEGEDAKEGHHVALSWKGGGHGGWMTGKHGGGMLC